MAGLACAFFLYAASGLLAPWWAVVVLMMLWMLMLVLALLWWSLHPRWLVWLSVFAIVFWFAAMVAGGVFLDWSA